MEIFGSIFKLTAGIGLLLFAMYLIEESLKNLSGRNFKIFLQRVAKNNLAAVFGGALITGILQSSSMVSLMVLAFVESGVFTMKNAMAIILGANLGTTLDSWLVATLGFNANIEVIAYPTVFVGGILLMFFKNQKSIKYLSYFLFGFGLLFIGLAFMKTSMEYQVATFDFSKYSEMPKIVFLLIGFLITILVQSSSVTMAITLSAIHTGIIDFPAAAVLILGSETSTTIKILVSTAGGSASKKRVAFGNLLFNIFLTVFTFIFLKPILLLITGSFNISNPLIGLVAFSSFINLISILIFLPFLSKFAKFLEHFYKTNNTLPSAFIVNANIEDPENALELFREETEYFINNSMLFNLNLFDIDITLTKENDKFKTANEIRKFFSKTHEEKYDFLKQLQGELQAFYLEFRTKLQGEQNEQLNQLISAVRSSMHATKSIKDIGSNINNLKRSSKDIKFDFFMHHKNEMEILYIKLNTLISQNKKGVFKELRSLFENIQSNYTTALNNFYKDFKSGVIKDLDITTALNFNRELFTSHKAMLMAVKDLLLDEKEALEFNQIPTYQT
ncbi:MAG: Na/Pi symporter [Bacteroidota bacterium]|nr:Na/Pi symporter [Bacteroidota bacterium]